MEKDVTRNIEEQLSAFLDGELPDGELQLLVRRLERDEEHRATLARYALIGDVLRNDPVQASGDRFRARVMAAIANDGESVDPVSEAAPPARRWVKPLASAAVVALAVVGLGNSGLFGEFPASAPPLAQQTAQSNINSSGSNTGSTAAVAQQVARVTQQPTLIAQPRLPRRAVVNRERMTSYLVSHGDYARTFQGPMGDSRIFVQQARFEQ